MIETASATSDLGNHLKINAIVIMKMEDPAIPRINLPQHINANMSYILALKIKNKKKIKKKKNWIIEENKWIHNKNINYPKNFKRTNINKAIRALILSTIIPANNGIMIEGKPFWNRKNEYNNFIC